MTFAKTTKVPISRSKDEIERIVEGKYGGSNFNNLKIDGNVRVVFQMAGRNILFQFHQPEDAQEARSIWRAVLLTIKGKLESAERGIETFEEAFLANIVMPDGRTVGQSAIPAIEKHYCGDASIPLLPKME